MTENDVQRENKKDLSISSEAVWNLKPNISRSLERYEEEKTVI